jgi:hypothetical protein
MEKELFTVGLSVGLLFGFIFGCIVVNIFCYDGEEMNDVLFYTLIDKETLGFIESQFDQGKLVRFNSEYRPCASAEYMLLDKDKQLLWKQLKDNKDKLCQ